MLKHQPRMREFQNSLIRCRITWGSILRPLSIVTTDPTRCPRSSRQFANCHTGTTQVPVIYYNKSIQKGVTSCFNHQSTLQTHQEQNTTDGQTGQLGTVHYGSEEMRVFIILHKIAEITGSSLTLSKKFTWTKHPTEQSGTKQTSPKCRR